MEEETGLGSKDWKSSWILNNMVVEELRLNTGKGKRGYISGEQEERASSTSSIPPLGESLL